MGVRVGAYILNGLDGTWAISVIDVRYAWFDVNIMTPWRCGAMERTYVEDGLYLKGYEDMVFLLKNVRPLPISQ